MTMMKVWGVEVGRLSSWQLAVCRLQVAGWWLWRRWWAVQRIVLAVLSLVQFTRAASELFSQVVVVARCTLHSFKARRAFGAGGKGKGYAEMAASLWRKQQVVMRRNMVQNISIRKRRVAGKETERRRNEVRELWNDDRLSSPPSTDSSPAPDQYSDSHSYSHSHPVQSSWVELCFVKSRPRRMFRLWCALTNCASSRSSGFRCVWVPQSVSSPQLSSALLWPGQVCSALPCSVLPASWLLFQ